MWGKVVLGTTTLHNGMILSTLNISSRGFALGFPKRPPTNEDVFLTYKPMIIPEISQMTTRVSAASSSIGGCVVSGLPRS